MKKQEQGGDLAMPKTLYRKKPVVIEAWQAVEDAEFPPGAKIHRLLSPTGSAPPQWQVFDELHQTWVNFDLGDWIIKGVKGEFYPCKPDVFAATYEPVDTLLQQPPAVSVEQAKDKLRQAFRREWSATFPPAMKRKAEDDAMVDLITAVEAATRHPQKPDLELTNARLALNDWHACATNEELERWRAAQSRLIDAAKAVSFNERAKWFKAGRRSAFTSILGAIHESSPDLVVMCPCENPNCLEAVHRDGRVKPDQAHAQERSTED